MYIFTANVLLKGYVKVNSMQCPRICFVCACACNVSTFHVCMHVCVYNWFHISLDAGL